MSRIRAGDGSIQLRLVRVRLGGMQPRNPNGAWRGPAGRRTRQARAATSLALLRRMSARSRRPGSGRSL
eukprot:2582770-Pleurochrysis_carterae.AAC.1